MIEITDKSKCCGCTACKSICPKQAITMKQDEEGFLYPMIDKTKCVNCGKCDRVCPIKNEKEDRFEQKAYIVNHKNEEVREDSTSGGAFTPIAKYVLERDGVVFGARFNEKFEVIHTYIEDERDLYKFRGSKYVQSKLGNSFNEVNEFLNAGRIVCFSGTPCQIEGLKLFLKRKYDNLITVDVMCHAVPSPLFWEKYKKYIVENKLNDEKIEKILFRDKSKYGYKYSTMTIKGKNKEYSKGVETDPYLRAFFGDLSDRPSCYDCKFKKQYHVSDFTIWDCFTVEKFDKNLDDDKGTSRILVNTKNGRNIFNDIKENFNYIEVEANELVKNVKEMLHSVDKNEKRKQFFLDLNELEKREFFEKWFPDSLKVKVERLARVSMAKMGIYKIIKKTAKKILGK